MRRVSHTGAVRTLSFVAAAEGDLAGNWSWTVWLLIPLALVLAVITALCLGPGGEPDGATRSSGGVSRYLARRTGEDAA